MVELSTRLPPGGFLLERNAPYTCLASRISYLMKNFKLPTDSEIERFSSRLPRRTLYYQPVNTATLTNSFTYTATDLINNLFTETIPFDCRLIPRIEGTIFSKLLTIDNDNSLCMSIHTHP